MGHVNMLKGYNVIDDDTISVLSRNIVTRDTSDEDETLLMTLS